MPPLPSVTHQSRRWIQERKQKRSTRYSTGGAHRPLAEPSGSRFAGPGGAGASIPRMWEESTTHRICAPLPPPPPPAPAPLAAPPPPPSTAAMLTELAVAPPSSRPRRRHHPPGVRPCPAGGAPAPPRPPPAEPPPPPGRRHPRPPPLGPVVIGAPATRNLKAAAALHHPGRRRPRRRPLRQPTSPSRSPSPSSLAAAPRPLARGRR